MKIENFQSQICVCAASTNSICAESSAEMERKMIIMRISPGLANALYEFAAAYALSKELNQELVLDIAECTVSAWGYSLDYFNIPRVKKIIYPTVNAMEIDHESVAGIPEGIKQNKAIYVQNDIQNDNEKYEKYTSLDQALAMDKTKDIYLCGYFFDRNKYYLKYWDEIRGLFTLKEQFAEVERFKDIIRGKVSVGVHIRRGDMLLADWAVKMEDDYYKAAISCCREHFGECVFMIFSDDMEYAKKILGKDSSLFYVHFLGYDNAALKEFICLSLCTHRIMSNSSTFSQLADELNWAEDRKTFWKDTSPQNNDKNISAVDFSRRNIRLNQYDIANYSKRYVTDKKENLTASHTTAIQLLEREINEDNCQEIFNQLCLCSMNVFEIESGLETQLLYKNFLCNMKLKKFQEALQSAFKLYYEYSQDREFTDELIRALQYIGFYEEAVVEQIRIGRQKLDYGSCGGETLHYCRKIAGKLAGKRKKHFIMIPYTPMYASSRLIGLVELGMVLYHLGHRVSFVFSPLYESEKVYIRENRLLTNRQGVCLGCEQYLEDDIENGIEGFLQQFADEDIVVVSRKSKYFADKGSLGSLQIKYVFPDFTDNRDGESLPAGQTMEKEELRLLNERADFILTKCNEKENGKYVRWEDNGSKSNYEVIDADWEFGQMGRLSKWAIGMAADLMASLQ